MPIQAPATTPLQTIDPPQQPLLWGAAVLEEDAREDAASWCRDSVLSSTFFEKLAVQTSLGVGILRRTDTTTTIPSHESDASSTLQTPAPIEPPAGGLVPVFPAATCIHISEVDPERGLLRLASVPHWHLASPRSASEGDGSQAVPASRGETSTQHAAGGCCSALPVSSLGSLRPGDLCDFRAVGPMATMQAERDAYAWFHASRLSARISSSTSSAAPPPAMEHGGIQGCFAAGAASRCVDLFFTSCTFLYLNAVERLNPGSGCGLCLARARAHTHVCTHAHAPFPFATRLIGEGRGQEHMYLVVYRKISQQHWSVFILGASWRPIFRPLLIVGKRALGHMPFLSVSSQIFDRIRALANWASSEDLLCFPRGF